MLTPKLRGDEQGGEEQDIPPLQGIGEAQGMDSGTVIIGLL
jgi:hypothetical protein